MNGIDQIRKKVKNRELPPVVALGGNDRALVDDALLIIRQGYLTESVAELNHHKFTAKEDDLAELIPTLQSMPFLASYRVVELHGAEKILGGETSLVTDYLKSPNPSSLLVLVFGKADKKSKLIGALTQAAAYFDLSLAANSDRISFAIAEAKSHAMIMSESAAQFLVVASDGDLLVIKSTIDKLAVLHAQKEVTIDEIEKNIVNDGAEDVFLLARNICEGRLAESLLALGHLRNSHENAIKFLGVLTWQFRVLVHIRHCMDDGMSDWDIRKQVSVFGDRFSWMAHIARRRTVSFHIERLTRLLDCDQALKSSRGEPFHYLERVIYQSAVKL